MASEREPLRDWHRLFGLLLTDFFTGTPFVVEVERDLSVQQQLLDVVIVRRGRGRFPGRLPDGLEALRVHNLVTFKSHREALDAWAIKELVAHSVAYRKLVSPTPSDLLPENHFGLYAVAARFPQALSTQVPWERVGAGVYDCQWGTDTVRVVVARELSQDEHNAPLHLFSAQPALLEFGGRAYRRKSAETSALLVQLFEGFQAEGVPMPFTMEDFKRQFVKEHFSQLTRKERADVIKALPADERLEGLSAEQIREYLERLSDANRPSGRRPRRKK